MKGQKLRRDCPGQWWARHFSWVFGHGLAPMCQAGRGLCVDGGPRLRGRQGERIGAGGSW